MQFERNANHSVKNVMLNKKNVLYHKGIKEME